MIVSFVLPFYAKRPVGGVKVVYEYANYLVDNGHKVFIYYVKKETLNKIKLPSNFKKKLVKLIIAYRKEKWFPLNKNVRRISIDAITNNEIKNADIIVATAVETASPVARLSESKGKKIYLIQDFENWIWNDDEVFDTYRLGMINVVVASWLKKIVDKYSEQPAILLSNSINTKVFRVCTPVELRDRHSMAFHYREAPHKGAQYAIKTIQLLQKKYKDLRVYVVSTNNRPNDLPDCCVFLKDLSAEEVAAVNNKVRVFMCSSIEEGFGLPGLEAMACGCALASSKYQGVLEYAIDGKNALLAPIKDSEKMAENISDLFENDDLCFRIVHAGLETAQQKSLEVTGGQLETLLKEQLQ